MRRSITGFILATALIIVSSVVQGSNVSVYASSKVALQPGVADFIQNTYLSHQAELPNPNENVDVLKNYLDLKGSPEELTGFQALVKKYPDSKHAHNGLAMAYYTQYKLTNDSHLIQEALNEEMFAAKIAYSYGEVLFVPWIEQMSIDAGQPQTATKWFDQILKKQPDNYIVNLQYADLVKNSDSKKAEQLYQKAIDVRPAGNIDAHVGYAEFLLDNGRFQDALNNTILVGERAFYLDFLHGYALEKLGRGQEAVKYYKNFEQMSKAFPAPIRFEIKNSPYQQGITFNSTVGGGGQSVAEYNLSFVTACEAEAEPVGAQRQVAWSVRQRVNRGSISGCLSVNNSGSTLDDKYSNVVCQSNQYVSVTCSSGSVSYCNNTNNKNATSDQVASDVYNGNVPDPFTDYCPGGSDYGTNSCTDTCTGSSDTTSWHTTTPHSFLSNQYTPPYSCMSPAGNVCGDGGNDNYFYYNN